MITYSYTFKIRSVIALKTRHSWIITSVCDWLKHQHQSLCSVCVCVCVCVCVQILSTRPSQYLPAQSNSKPPGTRPIWQHCTVHCSATKQAGALTPRLHVLSVEQESWLMLPHFLLASSIYRCLARIWPVWRKPHQHKPDQPGVCDHVNLKTLVQTRMGDTNGNDSRSAM